MVGCAGKELELLWLLFDDLTFDVGDTVPLVPPFVGIHIVASPLVMTVILLLLDVELELTRLSCDTVLDEVLIEVTLMGLVVTETLALEEVPTVPLDVEPTLLPVLIQYWKIFCSVLQGVFYLQHLRQQFSSVALRSFFLYQIWVQC